MAYSEFPHAHYFEYDEHQLILLMKKLESEYAEILEKVRKAESDASAASNKVDSFVITMDAKITQTVNTAVDNATHLLRNDFNNLNRKFNEVQNEFNLLKSDVENAERKIDAVASKIENDIQNLTSGLDNFKYGIRAEVNKRLTKTEKEVSEKIISLDNLTAARMRELSEQIVLAMNMVKESAKVYTDDAISNYYTEISKDLETQLEAISRVINEIKESQIYNHVGWLWNNLCSIGGFSAIEIYNYGDFNVDMWNASEITCKEWFTAGKQKLGYNSGRIFDTMSGRFLDVGRVVQELVSVLNAQGIIKNGFNALSMKRGGKKKHGNR